METGQPVPVKGVLLQTTSVELLATKQILVISGDLARPYMIEERIIKGRKYLNDKLETYIHVLERVGHHVDAKTREKMKPEYLKIDEAINYIQGTLGLSWLLKKNWNTRIRKLSMATGKGYRISDLENLARAEWKKMVIENRTMPVPQKTVPFNDDFNNPPNVAWFERVMNEKFDTKKPIVFLPCALAGKTREKYGKKKISQSMSHQMMSAITRNPYIEKIIMSEPLTVIPYRIEDQMPDYEYPPKLLKKRPGQREIFIERLSRFLHKLKDEGHKKVYLIGGKDRIEILEAANKNVQLPVYIEWLKTGSTYYSQAAERLLKQIEKDQMLKRNITLEHFTTL